MTAIKDGETASDIFGGCAAIQWMKDVGVGIASAIGRSVLNAGQFISDWWKGFKEDWLNALPIIGNAFAEAGQQVNQLLIQPAITFGKLTIGVSFGSLISVGGMIADSLRDPCAKAIAAALGAGVALTLGWAGAQALAASGLGARIAARLALAVGLGPLIRGFVRGTMLAYNFNWQITDRQIQEQQESAFLALIGVAGDAAGTALGNLVCGGSVGAAVVTFNPRVAAQVWEVAGEEMKEEIVSSFYNLIQASWRTALQIGFLETYKNTRKFIKKAAQNPAMRALLPDSWENLIKTWGDEGNKPWSFAQAIEEKIEAISNVRLRTFLENAVESFLDGCWDSLVTVSYAV